MFWTEPRNETTIIYVEPPETRKPEKRYTFWNFLLDIILIGLTGGLWLLWIVIRFLRNNS